MPEPNDDAKELAGTLVIYGVFCLIMVGIYAWSVQRSHRVAQESYARLDEIARQHGEPPLPAPRRVSRAKPEANGDAA